MSRSLACMCTSGRWELRFPAAPHAKQVSGLGWFHAICMINTLKVYIDAKSDSHTLPILCLPCMLLLLMSTAAPFRWKRLIFLRRRKERSS